jgi:hypothetical protein
MKRAFKLLIASFLAASLSVATVVCCCIAPAVMAHFHKAAVCSHCHGQNSNDGSSNPAATCRYQLLNAELTYGRTITFSNSTGSPLPSPIFLDKHITTLPPPANLIYPPGSPPLGISFTPLYLRTFNLRV